MNTKQMYQKLVSVLHPDKNGNSSHINELNKLMKRLNVANDNNDTDTIKQMYEQYKNGFKPPVTLLNQVIDLKGKGHDKTYCKGFLMMNAGLF